MRRDDETVEVRRGMVQGVEAPEQFVWKSRLWLVHEVKGHWSEAGNRREQGSGRSDLPGAAE